MTFDGETFPSYDESGNAPDYAGLGEPTWSHVAAVAAFADSASRQLQSLEGILTPQLIKSLSAQIRNAMDVDEAEGDLDTPDPDSFDLFLAWLSFERDTVLKPPSIVWTSSGLTSVLWQPHPKQRLSLLFSPPMTIVWSIHDANQIPTVRASGTGGVEATERLIEAFDQATWIHEQADSR